MSREIPPFTNVWSRLLISSFAGIYPNDFNEGSSQKPALRVVCSGMMEL